MISPPLFISSALGSASLSTAWGRISCPGLFLFLRGGVLLAWIASLIFLSRAMLAGRGRIMEALLLGFATGILYGGIDAALLHRNATAFTEVFRDRADWVAFGLTGVVSIVALWVLRAWRESI